MPSLSFSLHASCQPFAGRVSSKPLANIARWVLPVMAWAAVGVQAQPVSGPDPDIDSNKLRWSLGASVGTGPKYPGSEERDAGVRPIIGLEWRDITLSTGGGGSLLDFDQGSRDSGLSASLYRSDGLRLSAGLRLDSGRSEDGDSLLRGLPEVRRTLRGRIALVHDFAPGWSARSAWSPDLLGRGGGARWDNTLRYRYRLTSATTVTFSGAVNLANGTYMRSYFGVPAGTTSNLPLFRAKGGMHNTSLGFDVRTNLGENWVLVGGVSYVQLRGDARRSPLTVKPDYVTASIGLAYRCCR